MKLKFPSPNSSDAEIIDDDGKVITNISSLSLNARAKGQVFFTMTVIPKDLEVELDNIEIEVICDRCGIVHKCQAL